MLNNLPTSVHFPNNNPKNEKEKKNVAYVRTTDKESSDAKQ